MNYYKLVAKTYKLNVKNTQTLNTYEQLLRNICNIVRIGKKLHGDPRRYYDMYDVYFISLMDKNSPIVIDKCMSLGEFIDKFTF